MGECLPEFRSLPWKDESQDKAEAMSWQATCSTWYTSSPPSHLAQCGFSLRPSLVDYHFGDMKERCNDADLDPGAAGTPCGKMPMGCRRYQPISPSLLGHFVEQQPDWTLAVWTQLLGHCLPQV